MALSVKNVTHAAERQTLSLLVDGLLNRLNKAEDRREIYLKLVDIAAKFYGKGASSEKLDAVRAAINDPDNRWIKFIDRVLMETDPHVAKTMLMNLGYESFFRGTKTIRANRRSILNTWYARKMAFL